MSEEAALLRGLVVRLAGQFMGAQRNMHGWDEARLREEMARAAALMDVARPLIGEEAIGAHREEVAGGLAPRDPVEVDSLTGFGLWAESYDSEDNALILLEEPVLERLLGDVEGKRVLDVGCGTGRHARRLAAQGALVTGLEPCPEMLAQARRQAEEAGVKVQWRRGAFGGLPREETFDLVMCNLVLSHVPELDGPVAEMAGCLRPGGRLIMSDFHYICLAIGWRTAFSHGGRRYHVENYRHTYGDYLKALQAAELEVEAMEDLTIDEGLRGKGKDGLVDNWTGFPFGMVVVGRERGG